MTDHDIPRKLAERVMRSRTVRIDRSVQDTPWPLSKRWPNVPTRVVLCTENSLYPADYFSRVAAERLGVVPDEIGGGHCVALSRPKELAAMLGTYV